MCWQLDELKGWVDVGTFVTSNEHELCSEKSKGGTFGVVTLSYIRCDISKK